MKKKICISVLAMGFVLAPSLMATSNYQGNFSVQKLYKYPFKGNFDNVWASMKNYDAQGYYGNARVDLSYPKDGFYPDLCINNDSHLAVNETVKCTGEPFPDFHQYYTEGYYRSINGSTTTKDQVYTILS